MFEQAKQKFKSQEGASLSMALMLMLMCTTVTAIVLAAATASAGRLKNLRETDRSYYNVTSAAKLLWDELGTSGLKIYVERSCGATLSDTGQWTTTDGSGKYEIGSSASNKDSQQPTLFQTMVTDMLFRSQRETRDGELTIESRNIGSVDVINSIDFGDIRPRPADYDYLDSDGIKYTFIMTPNDTAGSQMATPVKVTVQGEEGGYIGFTFAEESNPKSYCTLYTIATAETELIEPSDITSPGNKTIKLNTTVTLTRDYLSTGGA